MKRKSLEELFKDIDYSREIEKYEKRGYQVLNKFMNKLIFPSL